MNAIGHLRDVPKNTIAKLGARVELVCQTDAPIPVRWNFSPAGSQNRTVIYLSGVITHSLKNKYAIDNDRTGRYNLIMNSVDLSFGGSYTCSDAPSSQSRQRSTRSSGSAKLMVIGIYAHNLIMEQNVSINHVVLRLCTYMYAKDWFYL